MHICPPQDLSVQLKTILFIEAESGISCHGGGGFLQRLEWRTAETGAPVVQGDPVLIICRLAKTVPQKWTFL